MQEIPPDWTEFFNLLTKHRVDFIVVGAYAMAAHGYVRATMDVDVFVRPTRSNAKRLGAALREFGFGALAQQWEEFMRDDVMVALGYEPNRIDLLTWISGVSFAEAWRTRTTLRLGTLTLPALSRVALLKNKTSSDRLKDRADAEALRTVAPKIVRARRR